MIYRTEITVIDGQNATLHVFPYPITVGCGDTLAVHFAGNCYKYDCQYHCTVYGVRNDGHPVELKNGSYISCNHLDLLSKDAEVEDHKPLRTYMCKECWGVGEVEVENGGPSPVPCEGCGGECFITE